MRFFGIVLVAKPKQIHRKDILFIMIIVQEDVKIHINFKARPPPLSKASGQNIKIDSLEIT